MEGYDGPLSEKAGDATDEGHKKTREDGIKSRLNWLTVCVSIAEIYNCKLNEIYELGIAEFLNLVNYINYRNKEVEKKYHSK